MMAQPHAQLGRIVRERSQSVRITEQLAQRHPGANHGRPRQPVDLLDFTATNDEVLYHVFHVSAAHACALPHDRFLCHIAIQQPHLRGLELHVAGVDLSYDVTRHRQRRLVREQYFQTSFRGLEHDLFEFGKRCIVMRAKPI